MLNLQVGKLKAKARYSAEEFVEIPATASAFRVPGSEPHWTLGNLRKRSWW